MDPRSDDNATPTSTAADPLESYRYVTRAEEARAALEAMRSCPTLGLDTETSWDANAGRHRLALVQLAAPGAATLVLDAHAPDIVPLLGAWLAAPSPPRFVAHNASFDAAALAGAGAPPAALVDTLRLAREALPQSPSHALAELVASLFGVALDKSLQRSAWHRRPLTAQQLAYAAADARWSLRLYDALRAQLVAAGRWDDALARATVRPSDPSTPRRARRPMPAPDAPPLTAAERQLVARLKAWRQRYAAEQRVPVYRVCPDRTLEQLARERPTEPGALLAVYGLGAAKIERFGAALLAALREAQG